MGEKKEARFSLNFLRIAAAIVIGGGVILILTHFVHIDFYLYWALALAYTLPCSFLLPLFAVGEKRGVCFNLRLSFHPDFLIHTGDIGYFNILKRVGGPREEKWITC